MFKLKNFKLKQCSLDELNFWGSDTFSLMDASVDVLIACKPHVTVYTVSLFADCL